MLEVGCLALDSEGALEGRGCSDLLSREALEQVPLEGQGGLEGSQWL